MGEKGLKGLILIFFEIFEDFEDFERGFIKLKKVSDLETFFVYKEE
jgi:hypothetical protein